MIITQTIIVFLLALLIAGLALKAYFEFKKEIKKKPQVAAPRMEFENDIVHLNYMINHKIQQTKTFILQPLKISGTTIIKDTDFEKYKDDIIVEVYISMSPMYKRAMSKYFTDEALMSYITEMVMKEMTVICLEMNLSFFNKKPF